MKIKFKKKIVYSLLTLQLLTVAAPVSASAQILDNIPNGITDSATPCADDIRWQYKMIGNDLYRRKYNYSTQTPLTDWELVP